MRLALRIMASPVRSGPIRLAGRAERFSGFDRDQHLIFGVHMVEFVRAQFLVRDPVQERDGGQDVAVGRDLDTGLSNASSNILVAEAAVKPQYHVFLQAGSAIWERPGVVANTVPPGFKIR